MDVTSRAEQLTAHIDDPARRDRVRTNLANFLSTLEDIPADDEVYTETDGEDSYRDAGEDGVPRTTLAEINSRESERLTNLRDLHRDVPRASSGKRTATPTIEVEVAPSIDAQGKGGQTQLHRAVIAGDLALVSELLQKGARTDIEDQVGMTALDRARFRADDSETAGRIADLIAAH
jgi:hypothetical protein